MIDIHRLVKGALKRMKWLLHQLSRRRPSAREIIPKYTDYVTVQIQDQCSWESANPHYREGQRRYVQQAFVNIDRDLKILDMACGDGVGLQQLKELGFQNVTGVDLNAEKSKCAKARSGYEVFCLDMHDLSSLRNGSFDIVYSSHTLEHAYDTHQALSEICRVLKPAGFLLVVLPYPERDPTQDRGHCSKYELGIDILDDGKTVTKYFTDRGFILVSKEWGIYRQPEIWLKLQKN